MQQKLDAASAREEELQSELARYQQAALALQQELQELQAAGAGGHGHQQVRVPVCCGGIMPPSITSRSTAMLSVVLANPFTNLYTATLVFLCFLRSLLGA